MISLFILTDGKNYVMENPCKRGDYISTTSPNMAKEFTFKQTKSLLQNTRKQKAWIRTYYRVNKETGEKDTESTYYKGSGGIYVGDRAVEFDESILDIIYGESNSIMGLAGWSMTQLRTYEEKLKIGLSICDSAESDILHALQKYKEDKRGKRPAANKMSQVGYILDDVRDKHKNIKQCMNYISVLEDAITYGYTIEKLKLELEKAKFNEYKGRTDYYNKVLNILG